MSNVIKIYCQIKKLPIQGFGLNNKKLQKTAAFAKRNKWGIS